MNTKSHIQTLILSILSLCLFGCLSASEIKERQDDAFDLSGYYNTASKSGNAVNMSFTIVNVEGRHKIKAIVNRKSPLLVHELEKLNAYSIDINSVKKLIMAPDLIFDRDLQYNGGGNVSTDNGKTSTFDLCTQNKVVDNSVKNYDSATIRYCLTGTVTKPISEMTGKLSLEIILSKRTSDDYDSMTFEDVTIPFTTDFKNGFHTQFMGRWIGEVHSSTDKYIGQIVGVDFTKAPGEKYTVRPLYREMTPAGEKTLPKDTITFNGEEFTFISVEDNLDELDNEEFPMIRSLYKNKNSNNRIIIIGTIWSLGNFSGNILFVTNNSENKVGSFQFVKQQ